MQNRIMKKIILVPLLFASLLVFAQEKMITKSGIITFDASFPSYDEVKGTNIGATVVLNPETGEIASLALMKGFHFEIALMEEHFNENYMETDRYPKAIFRGQIEAFDRKTLTSNPKDFVMNGKLEKREIISRSNIPSEQYWERKPLPDWYKKVSKDEDEYEKRRKEDDPPFYDERLAEYVKTEWDRRLNGCWFMNNGVPHYITGMHY